MADPADRDTDAAGATPTRKQKKSFSIPLLVTLVTLATLAPMIAFGGVALYLWHRTESADEAARLTAHAESLSQAVDREIRGYREIVEGLASSPALKSDEILVFWRFAQEVSNHIGGHFALIDPVMRQLVNTSAPLGAELTPALATAAIKRVIATGSTVVTNFEPRPISGKTQFTVLTPVTVGGRVRYVLGYAPAPGSIQAIVQETYRPDGWLAAILDRKGNIVARSEAYDEFFGRPASAVFLERTSAPSGSVESTDLQGRVSRTAWTTNSSGWKIVVWAPTGVLEHRTRLAAQTLALAALAAVFLSLLASWLASRLIRAPAQRLVEAAHSLGVGEVVEFTPTRMREANEIGWSLANASELIHRRESDLRASQTHADLIMRELSHRSKNLLALVQAVARQSARGASSIAEFQPRFSERLQSLAASHDLLVKTNWTSVPMRDLINEQMRPFVDRPAERILMSGHHLMVRPEAAQNLGMAFHELGSNAVKHGSLSAPDGVVHIDWHVESGETPLLVLRWSETGGPPVRSPDSRGFGTVIIQKLIPQNLRGSAEMSWDEAGFTWTLRAPLDSVTRTGTDRRRPVSQA